MHSNDTKPLLSPAEAQAAHAWLAARVPPLWQDTRAECLSNAAAELEDHLARWGGPTPDVERFARHIKLDDDRAGELRLRRLEGSDGLVVLTHQRFFGGDPTRPFIEVVAQTRGLRDSDWPALSRAIADAHAGLGSRRARIWGHQAGFTPAAIPGAEADFHLVLGDIAHIQRQPRPEGYDRVALEPATADQLLAEYAVLYRDFHDDAPHLRTIVPKESRETIAACEHPSLLARVRIDGSPEGLIAARPDAVASLPCWLVIEEVLSRRTRGRGFAAALQRHLIDSLDPRRAPYLVGMIAAVNEPSLRTAARNHRQPVGTWWFVPFA